MLSRHCMDSGLFTAYSRGIPPPGYTRVLHSEACSAVGRAPLTSFSCRAFARLRESPNALLQGLELLVMVLLVRNRQPPPTVAAGVPHAEFAAELITLPSGLLAMVCQAIAKLKVRLRAARVLACLCACACLRACMF